MHILIGTDGSEIAVRAARRGIELLVNPDRVTILTVLTDLADVDTGEFGGSPYSPAEQAAFWRTYRAEANAEIEETVHALSGSVDRRIELGSDGVAEAICAVATELGVDAIVIGSHARSGLGRLLLGSTSEHVVRHAPCPVLVVRDGPADASESSALGTRQE
jgi:nucleotide-binding universal stress UspA family protein